MEYNEIDEQIVQTLHNIKDHMDTACILLKLILKKASDHGKNLHKLETDLSQTTLPLTSSISSAKGVSNAYIHPSQESDAPELVVSAKTIRTAQKSATEKRFQRSAVRVRNK